MRSSSLAVSLVIGLTIALVACGSEPAPPPLPPPTVASAAPVASASAPPPPPAAPGPPRFPADWPYAQGGPAPHSSKGMVASDSAIGTKVGVDVLAAGGNAVDASVALAFAIAVAFPTAGNLGGGGFMVARVAGKAYALDFRETAPAAATRDMYLGPDGKPTEDSWTGWKASGTPGSVAGLYEAWSKLGSKKQTWAELLAPAIALADPGFVVDDAYVKTLTMMQKRLAKFPESAKLFLPGGAPPAVGSTFKNPELAAVLRRIAKDGPAGFYQGPVAKTLAAEMKKNGGLITTDDLAKYAAKWRTPFEYDYRGHHVIGMPPPSSGGLTDAMIAHLLEGTDVASLGWHSAAHVHFEAEAMRRAFAARNAKLGDPDFVQNPVDELMSPAWTQAQRATMLPDKATSTHDLFPNIPLPKEGTHTTHFSVVDADGNAVGITTTLNAWFGSGVTVPGLGFVMNDEMDDFATVPGQANGYGLAQGEPNAIAPGKRMLSSMSPSILLAPDGSVQAVLGAAGGPRIITAVFQEMSNIVDFGMAPADAVRAPRIHQQDSPDVIALEPRGLPEDVVSALHAMGHATKEVGHLADGPGIGKLNGLWEGASEPRREGGLAAGVP
jgi:gamma-glutamyltranspeptidase/glutathione hydrolase